AAAAALDPLNQAAAEEAEAQAALAEARANAARARAELLRRQAEAGVATQAGLEQPAPHPTAAARRSTATWAAIAVAAAALAVCGLVGFSAFMAWQQHSVDQERERHAEYAAVARQGVVNLMSLDFTNAEENVQRVIDSATGEFREEFEAQSEFLVESLEASKVITEVTVNSVAVESVAEESPVVLVAAESQATNAQDARKDPQRFRVAVTLARDGDELKIARVDFL
ncbi:hypothetical protein, partial [Mycolicibacterium chitae]